MRIPSVKENDTLAKLTPPTDGKDGRTVTDEVIPAKRGKPYHIRPGKNVKFNDSDQTLYAILDGQVVINQNIIEVQPVFEVRSEEHTSELQSRGHLVCRLLLEKKKKTST